MHVPSFARWTAALAVATLCLAPVSATAQTPDQEVFRINLPVGRSYPIEMPTSITRVSVANPEIADVAVVGDRDVVINARASGETDVILWAAGIPRRHYRIQVASPADRMQVVLGVKIAEVRKDVLHELGVSGLFRDDNTRIGTGIFRSDNVFRPDGTIQLPTETRHLTILSDLGTSDFLGFLEAQTQSGNARLLAEPSLMAGNREEASFLAGGEFPVPVVQPGQGGAAPTITVEFREFGIRLTFLPEIVSDSLIKLRVRPEVSSLDFVNAVIISGFRIPALRTRYVQSTVDVRRNQSLVISGLFNEEREQVRTGVPFLMDIPILGALFSSSRWQTNESELVIVVTPVLVDPMRARAPHAVPLQPTPPTELPAREALEPRLTPPAQPAPQPPPRP